MFALVSFKIARSDRQRYDANSVQQISFLSQPSCNLPISVHQLNKASDHLGSDAKCLEGDCKLLFVELSRTVRVYLLERPLEALAHREVSKRTLDCLLAEVLPLKKVFKTIRCQVIFLLAERFM